MVVLLELLEPAQLMATAEIGVAGAIGQTSEGDHCRPIEKSWCRIAVHIAAITDGDTVACRKTTTGGGVHYH